MELQGKHDAAIGQLRMCEAIARTQLGDKSKARVVSLMNLGSCCMSGTDTTHIAEAGKCFKAAVTLLRHDRSIELLKAMFSLWQYLRVSDGKQDIVDKMNQDIEKLAVELQVSNPVEAIRSSMESLSM
jgi:hypothetical protein